ncbi:YpdA family putative bacillithiol disulfide reductase [Salicibibacter kimchii]|uniref:YpdA family putative bacillithiol disulfide reductase n=1 Tax=Salicibibacter kimchii TaxID=2099786 RepID=A0A345BV81_9BACI|nr:YpdA family putative bacillithiol disulfide reductase [Salicibibacter kimchii]AXF54862.1 YpdA family putative bacillithiol disulfide reductase [Salicibibacter kimchii]
MVQEKIMIIGAGPCGLAAAIACREKGYDPLIIEKGNIVSAIYHYPTHQTFFSTPNKLEIGDIPFVTVDRKPRRNEALAYYREVVDRTQLRIHTYETAENVRKTEDGTFVVETTARGKKNIYRSDYVIMATGYYDHPNKLGCEGEELPHVYHYFKESHPFHGQNVVVIGGRNSAVDATLELEKAGARVTVLYRGDTYSSSIKPWILPEFESLVRKERIRMIFGAEISRITETSVYFEKDGQEKEMDADFVFAMIGYHPDHLFLTAAGVGIDEHTGRPFYDPESFETDVPGLFIAGVVAAGNNANEILIETGRFHGHRIAETIANAENVQRT